MPQGISVTGRSVLVLGRNPGDSPIMLRLTNDGWVIANVHLQVNGNPVTAANPVPITGPGPAGAMQVIQAIHDLLNCNANIQVGDADVANLNPVPISDAGGVITVDGTVTVQEPLSVDDNGGSLTVDNAALSVVGGGVEALALRVTVANNSTGVLSVDDNPGSLTVDQATHDNFQCNANIQVGDADVGPANLVPVDVANNVAATFDHGSNSAIGVAATRFIVASVPATLGVEVKAANGNTANIYVGNADVTAATADATDGMELGPGESILVRIDDVNKLYGISTASDQRVFWLVV